MNSELVGDETGLVAYYNFNHGLAGGTNTGITTLEDLTANNFDGTLNGPFALTGTSSNWVSSTVDISGIGVFTDFPPVSPTLADVTGECSAIVTAPTTEDACAGTITGTTFYPLTYNTQGTHVIAWTYDDGNGNTSTQTQNVVINDVTNPIITCLDNQTKQLLEGETVYKVSGTEFNPTESSDNCDGFSIANDFNSSTTLENAEFPIGLTTVIWTITDIAGNENTCSFDVTENAFVGLEKLLQKGISIYPNPTNGIVNFQFNNNNIQKISISDITGKQIIEKTEIQQNEQIDLSGFDSGIYIISIQTDNEIFTTKVIKE